jgi:hypothetical protein
MGRRLDAFLEAVGKLRAAEAGYSEQMMPSLGDIQRHKARQAARELHEAMSERGR